MVITTYKCDRCGKEETSKIPIGYVGINGYRFEICRECLKAVVTDEMLEKRRAEVKLRSIMDKTAIPFD